MRVSQKVRRAPQTHAHLRHTRISDTRPSQTHARLRHTKICAKAQIFKKITHIPPRRGGRINGSTAPTGRLHFGAHAAPTGRLHFGAQPPLRGGCILGHTPPLRGGCILGHKRPYGAVAFWGTHRPFGAGSALRIVILSNIPGVVGCSC